MTGLGMRGWGGQAEELEILGTGRRRPLASGRAMWAKAERFEWRDVGTYGSVGIGRVT